MLYFLLRYVMIANEMFGGDTIRVKIKGYLKNNNDKEITNFDEIGIKNKDKITFSSDNVKYVIRYDDNKVYLTREGNDYINTFVFNKKKSTCTYLLKEQGFNIDIDIKVIDIDINDNNVYVKYVVIDSNNEYEFKIEASDIL